MIELVNVSKSFKNIEAVKEVSLEVREGEILGLLGPNGAGKSTTISMISTLIVPSAGQIYFEGEEIFKNTSLIRNALGVVPQEIALYPELTGYDNLKFFGKVYGLRGKELEQRIQEVLDIIQLNGRAKEPLKNYSGGMKRRVNIGCALLHHPKVLIMDEPTVGIDPQSRNHILETVKRLNGQGMTIIYTSHYMEEVEFLCHRIYIMDRGQIIASGSKEDLKRGIAQEDRVDITVDRGLPELPIALEKIPGVSHALLEENTLNITHDRGVNILEGVFRTMHENGVKIQSVDVRSPTLEDVFLRLTGKKLRD